MMMKCYIYVQLYITKCNPLQLPVTICKVFNKVNLYSLISLSECTKSASVVIHK